MTKKSEESFLGDFIPSSQKFQNLPQVLKGFQGAEFQKLTTQEQYERVNRVLFDLIDHAPSPCFLLPAVIDYIEQINALGCLETYAFNHFELWLNQFSGLDDHRNYLIRGKICGKSIPRDEYQLLFPIGMGKVYPGSHFVTGHGSPDIDTTVASFWGWVDAFAARVAEGLHLWNVPGGPPGSSVEIELLFNQIFGEGIFTHLAKTRTTLALSGMELVTQKGLKRLPATESMIGLDHEKAQSAIVLTDEDGYYLGDWHTFDVEGVRQVIMLLHHCLRWFQNHLHIKLISLFAKETLNKKELSSVFDAIFRIKMSEASAARQFTFKQEKLLHQFLSKVLQIKNGLECTYEAFAESMNALSLFNFKEFVELAEALKNSSLFDKAGSLVENRSLIFNSLEKIITALDRGIESINGYVETLNIALSIKTSVLDHQPQFVSFRADVEEIRNKMDGYSYLTVTAPDKEGKLVPLGVIHAIDMYKSTLGTVTLRDFCNREETKIPAYFEVISVIDHHKVSLQTLSAPLAIIGDAQSSNVLCAEKAFIINDRFGKEHSLPQIDELKKDLSSPSANRCMQRALKRALTNDKNSFIDSDREYIEYLHFLYAILDDTDLLAKVTQRDIECVAELLNRLKSITVKKEVEIISFDDLPRDRHFVRNAAKRILQNRDMYSIYRKIYLAKEEVVEENIKLCAERKPSVFFIDTKEQNGCARVGQTKLFASNVLAFEKHTKALRRHWYDNAIAFYQNRNEFNLHMHMVSTIAGAEQVFAGNEGEYSHLDEMWVWIPFTDESIEHLKSFLNAFSASPALQGHAFTAEFYGERAKNYEQIFNESFLPLAKKDFFGKEGLSIAVLKFKPGLINSRKAMISPFLPKV